MRRSVRVFLALTSVLASGAFVAPRLAPTGSLPTLRNGPDWRGLGAVAPPSVGRDLLLPVDDAIWFARGRLLPPVGGVRSATMTRALLDLRGLQLSNGAVLAGPSDIWAYTWPRDTAFAAVAYAVSGHPADAWRALAFLSTVQRADGGFEARYLPDGSGPPDGRERQSDGAGWVLWALDAARAASGSGPVPVGLRDMRDRATRFVLRETRGGRDLPTPSPDYWEVPERKVTLGTVAPLAAGLESAARTYAAEGDSRMGAEVHGAAQRLRALLAEHFGPGYQRHGSSGGVDAAVVMLLPPFASEVDAAAVTAWQDYQVRALRSAGGLAPGAEWKRDGVSWTPETALVAYTAAASGDAATARRWLHWLDDHVTAWGSLPEKVRPDGTPAGPAPLAWTAALVVLTEHELARSR
jgi:GH15 family glucan-1,4-alpha-glucosidase